MSKANGSDRKSVTVVLNTRFADRSFEIVCTELAFEAISGADRLNEALKRSGERFNFRKDEPGLAIGLSGKYNIDFTRDAGRVVPGSLLLALAGREGVSDVQKQVLGELATFVAGYQEGTVPTDLGLAGLVGSYHNVTENNWSRHFARQFRGAFRNWFEARVRKVHSVLEAEAVCANWDEAGQGRGAVVSWEVTPETLRRLFRDHGFDFVVVQADGSDKVQTVLWDPSGSSAALVDSAVTEHIGTHGAEGEYASWDSGALPRLGLRSRYPLEGHVTEMLAIDVFTAIMAKITATASHLQVVAAAG